MPANYWVLTAWLVTQSPTEICLTAETTNPQHLYLCVQTTYPIRTPRWRVRRGRREQCGWLWRWQPLECIEQTQAGNTTLHSMCLAHAPTDPPLWATLTTGDPTTPGTPQLPPIPLSPNAVPPLGDHILDTFTRPNQANGLGSTESPAYPWLTYSKRSLGQWWEIFNHTADCDSNLAGPPLPADPQNIAIVAHDLTSPDMSCTLTHPGSPYPVPFGRGPAIRVLDNLNYLYASRDFIFSPLFPFRIHAVSAGVDVVIATSPAATFALGDSLQLSALGSTLTVTKIHLSTPTIELTTVNPIHGTNLRAGIAAQSSSASAWSLSEIHSPP